LCGGPKRKSTFKRLALREGELDTLALPLGALYYFSRRRGFEQKSHFLTFWENGGGGDASVHGMAA
jgi:hypothetical protein